MILIGVVLLLLSFGSTMYALLRPDWIDAQLAHQRELVQGNPMLERPVLTWVIAVFGLLGVLESGLSIVLGLYTRRGVRWAIVTALVLTALRVIVIGLLFVLAMLTATLAKMIDTANGTTAQTPDLTGWLVGSATSTLVLGVLIVWLIQALRAPSPSLLGSGPG